MKRLFGRSPGAASSAPAVSATATAASLDRATSHVSSRIQTIDGHIASCDAELTKYRAQLQKVTSNKMRESVRQRAMAVLKKKRMYEDQRDALQGTQLNLDQVQFATEQLQTTALTVESMKVAATQLKSEYKKMNIDDIERAQDDMADLLLDHQEITDVLSRNYTLPEDVDEAELEAEFEALSMDATLEGTTQPPEATAEDVLCFLPSTLPNPPATPVAGPSSSSALHGGEEGPGGCDDGLRLH